ncbi:MAG: sulfatase-like hydrolase/transferase [Muribaculaceae bacterium]
MKPIKRIFSWINNQQVIFWIFVVIISLPNFVLFFTERMPLLTKVCNVVLPFSVFWALFTFTRKPGKMFWILFLFIFYDAFQIVLLYLFGEAVIAVDMFLNVLTTNTTEINELLGNLIPGVATVFIIYGAAIFLAIRSLLRRKTLSTEFCKQQRRYAMAGIGAGMILMVCCAIFTKGFNVLYHIFPVNVTYNMVLAIERQIRNDSYLATSKDFTFGAKSLHAADEQEIYVMVIGETARAMNFGVYGYERPTTPYLDGDSNVVVYRDAVTESNTTHKSVPMLLSAISAQNFGAIYEQKSIITAFKEAGFYTMFLSNQRPNHSFIDYFGEEADYSEFIKENLPAETNVLDGELLPMLDKQLAASKSKKIFMVLHTYGSHFNYRERYKDEDSYFKPDTAMDAKYKNKEMLMNAYDNTIRYTDKFLGNLIDMLKKRGCVAALAYTSDHGEDIFDDERRMFLHASPIPSYYQLHVPLIFWASDEYVANYGREWEALERHKDMAVSGSKELFHTMLTLGGIESGYRIDSLSMASPGFKESQRYYLNDHNEEVPISETGMGQLDEAMFAKKGLRYP